MDRKESSRLVEVARFLRLREICFTKIKYDKVTSKSIGYFLDSRVVALIGWSNFQGKDKGFAGIEGISCSIGGGTSKDDERNDDGGEGLYVRGRSGQRDMGHDTYSMWSKSQGRSSRLRNEDWVSGSRADGYDIADIMMAMSVEELLD
nr:hypothetical protein [Tanacetum cinerariifolium]